MADVWPLTSLTHQTITSNTTEQPMNSNSRQQLFFHEEFQRIFIPYTTGVSGILSLSTFIQQSRIKLSLDHIPSDRILRIIFFASSLIEEEEFLTYRPQDLISDICCCKQWRKNAADKICTVYGSASTIIRTIRNWFKKFRADNLDLNDEYPSGHLATTDTDLIKSMLAENPLYGVRHVVNATDIPGTTVDNHKCSDESIVTLSLILDDVSSTALATSKYIKPTIKAVIIKVKEAAEGIPMETRCDAGKIDGH
uniref:HTH_48 domain-containing protein n=1 Tax=Glossina pallidipes TaxID=7398 RepID=A0A1B0A5A1_GLOPL